MPAGALEPLALDQSPDSPDDAFANIAGCFERGGKIDAAHQEEGCRLVRLFNLALLVEPEVAGFVPDRAHDDFPLVDMTENHPAGGMAWG